MTAARADATATLLNNGKVLIAGGRGCSDPKHCSNVAIASGAGGENLASAELYDPDTGKFTRTGSMAAPRENATATLLPDGRVLMAGFAQWAELYDPHTGKFTRTGQKTDPAGNNIATLLPNGKVLVTGDSLNGFVAQLYDETSGKFMTISLALPPGTPSVQYRGLTVPRTDPDTSTLLPGGRVLLYEGGYLETYDSASGACSDAGFVSPGAQWVVATATLLSDGRVLFEGGEFVDLATNAFANTDAAVLYDPTGGPLRRGSTQVARWGQTATLLPDGSVLLAGGVDNDGNPLSSAELFK
jgi:WD40 repeat protein